MDMDTKKEICDNNKNLVMEVNSVLFLYDFVGISNIEHPDEYEVEAIIFIYECKTKPFNHTPCAYASVLYKIFCDYFSPDIILEEADPNWLEAGSQIYELLKITSIK